MEKIRIGICGYGNLGRGVELALESAQGMELAAVFTRRDPQSVKPKSNVPVYAAQDAKMHAKDIDVMILCGGSATDLPEMGPVFARDFNTVDSFDTHAKIPDYFEKMNTVAKTGGNISIISVGWDPGLFSVMRALGDCVLPGGESCTFWGRGVSQGHSDAIRRIPGVKDAKQYTIPVEAAVEQLRAGTKKTLTTREKHLRECFVVAMEGADRAAIENAIKTMPNYFSDYDTTVHFISEEELAEKHSGMPHGGFVFRSGETNTANRQVMEFSLKLDSNPEFTAQVLVCYARAAFRLHEAGESGARTVLDIAPAMLSPKSAERLREELL